MTFRVLIPGLSLRSNPGLKLANASGVWFGSHFKIAACALRLRRCQR